LALLAALALSGCSHKGSEAVDASGQRAQAAAPDKAVAGDHAETYVQPQNGQPPPVITVEQAEKSCAEAAERASRKAEDNLFITVAICKKLQEGFPTSAPLKQTVEKLQKLAVEQGATSFHAP